MVTSNETFEGETKRLAIEIQWHPAVLTSRHGAVVVGFYNPDNTTTWIAASNAITWPRTNHLFKLRNAPGQSHASAPTGAGGCSASIFSILRLRFMVPLTNDALETMAKRPAIHI